MFKLQRLEITGFKSFADYTEIIFTGDGITAIVGPNGCGKSNVADAIAWVLGEQRVKHLRGGEMKDVIFQGSRNRPPSGMTEVVMHLIRDEVDAPEPDIDDIDSKLEKIDDQLVKSVAETDVDDTDQADQTNETNETGEKDAQRTPQKRHWRRRNLALEFEPGEAVSVTRRLYR
ncbi:MAG TPA: AAA family ATPase, partial [Pyrinomonadaceae bacterium]|nr:AAA family ATPase [Pyrinomonadaceae bacterium]